MYSTIVELYGQPITTRDQKTTEVMQNYDYCYHIYTRTSCHSCAVYLDV